MNRMKIFFVFMLGFLFLTSLAFGQKSFKLYWQTYPATNRETEFDPVVLQKFKEETGITVEPVRVSWEDGLNKIMAAVVAADGPDVFQIAEQWTGQMFATNAFIDMTDIGKKFGGEDAYFSGAMVYGKYKGRTYAYPWGGDCRAMYYRTDRYAKAGLALPKPTWKWSDMVSNLKKLKGVDNVEFPFVTEGAGTQFDVFYFWWYTQLARGGEFTNKDRTKATINTPQGRQALKDIVELVTVHKVMSPSFAEYDGTAKTTSLTNGSVSMIPCWTGVALEMEKAGLAGKFTSVTPPNGEDGKFGAMEAISLYSVPKYSKHQNEAMAFIEMLMRPDMQALYNKSAGWLPARIQAWNDPYFNSGWRAPIRYGMERGTALLPGHSRTAAICRIMAKHLNNVYASIALGKISDKVINDTLAAAEAEVNQELAKEK